MGRRHARTIVEARQDCQPPGKYVAEVPTVNPDTTHEVIHGLGVMDVAVHTYSAAGEGLLTGITVLNRNMVLVAGRGMLLRPGSDQPEWRPVRRVVVFG